MNICCRCHKLFSGVNDTSKKFIASVNLSRGNTQKNLKFFVGKKLFTGVNDTADKFFG
jgi:hypothetical protein